MDDREILYLQNQINSLKDFIKEQEERILNLEENQKYLDDKIQDIYQELLEKILVK